MKKINRIIFETIELILLIIFIVVIFINLYIKEGTVFFYSTLISMSAGLIYGISISQSIRTISKLRRELSDEIDNKNIENKKKGYYDEKDE